MTGFISERISGVNGGEAFDVGQRRGVAPGPHRFGMARKRDSDMQIERVRLEAGGITLSALRAGSPDGAMVMLLHGFPEQADAWCPQIERLAAAGFLVVAPDGRGYGQSDKPAGSAAYGLDILADDIAALASAIGRDRFGLVGHDWGGLVAWWAAARHPGRIRRLMTMNAPHPAVVRRFLRHHPSQLLRSWYVGFFQLPHLPEALLARGRYALLKRAMRASARPGTFPRELMRRYEAAWSRPGALTGMLDWYRALLRVRPEPQAVRIRCPCRILWGVHDRFLDRRFAPASLELCEQGDIVWFEQATHWLHREEPEAVAGEMLRFFAEAANPA
jgi:pimeloyl-ACP methyl ester carboxylesterase